MGKKDLTLGGLFEGIGGFPLAAQWAGITPLWSNEIDPFCCKVLKKNFRHEIIQDDIRNIGKHNLKPVDIISGGFPCQPFSKAGKKQGKKDNRYLWPEMLRIIREIEPTFVIGENVYGLIDMALDQVLDDLETLGYKTETYHLPAYTVGAYHNRDRIWIIGFKGNSHDTDTHSLRPHSKGMHIEGKAKFQHEQISLPGSLVSERVRKGTHPRVFRDIDGIPNRVDRLRAMGNAIVPQVAFELLMAIRQATCT